MIIFYLICSGTLQMVILVSILGYVIDVGKTWFKIHRGRDITSRMLMQFHDIPVDINDDR